MRKLIPLILCLGASPWGGVQSLVESTTPLPNSGVATVILYNAAITSSSSQAIYGLSGGEVDLAINVGTATSGSLTFTIADADPQNPNTVISGGASVSSAALTAAGSATISLNPSHSSAILVSWTAAGGPSFSGVYATLIQKPNQTQGVPIAAPFLDAGTVLASSYVQGSQQAPTLYVQVGATGTACTQSAPCPTFQQACDLVPMNVCDRWTIFADAGLYDAGCYLEGRNYRACPGVTNTTAPSVDFEGYAKVFSPATGPATGTFTSGTAGQWGASNGSGDPSPANWGTATLTAANWTVNNLVGVYLEITAGTGAGQEAVVWRNTASTITIIGAWPNYIGPDVTSQFVLYAPQGGTVIQGALPVLAQGGLSGLSSPYDAGAAFFISGGTPRVSYQEAFDPGFVGQVTGVSAGSVVFHHLDIETPGSAAMLEGAVAAFQNNFLTSTSAGLTNLPAVQLAQSGAVFQGNVFTRGVFFSGPVSFYLGQTGGDQASFIGNWEHGGFASFAEGGGAGIYAQQNVLENTGNGFRVGALSSLDSVGNLADGGTNLVRGSATLGSLTGTMNVFSDGDTCVSTVDCFAMTQGGYLNFGYDPLRGSTSGTVMKLGGTASAEVQQPLLITGATGDICIDAPVDPNCTYFSLSTLDAGSPPKIIQIIPYGTIWETF